MDDPPGILYHYTSFEAFGKIMESQMVRATHYSELDDPSEVTIGAEILERSLKARSKSSGSRVMKHLMTALPKFRKGRLDIFVFSLSEAADSLNQWRAYCPGGGVAIGFRGQDIYVPFRTTSRKTTNGASSVAEWKLAKCQYYAQNDTIDVTASVSDIRSKVQAWLQLWGKLDSSVKEELGDSYSSAEIERLCCSIKHNEYESEREWRLFYNLTEDTTLTVELDDRKRRFVKMPFVARDLIKEVVLSPHGGRRQDRMLAQCFKSSMHLSYEVKESEKPFRLFGQDNADS